MSTNDYIKYLTQQLVKYFEVPKTVRKEQRKHKKENRPTFSSQWFGIVPFAISMLLKRK